MAVSTTLNTMIPEFARSLGAYIGSFSTSTNIATTNLIVSTDLGGYFDSADVLNDSFVRILGTNNDDVKRLVTDTTVTSGIVTLTVAGAALSAESGSVSFQLYRYDPAQLVDALNDAREVDFPSLHKKVTDRSNTVGGDQFRYSRPTSIQPRNVRQVYLEPRIAVKRYGNNIVQTLDCDFEGDLTDWATSSLTLAAEAETTTPKNFAVFADQQSGKWTVATGATGTALLTVPSGTGFEGEEINNGIWVYSLTSPTTTSYVKAAVVFDGGTAAVGTAHTGNGWERLTVASSDQSIATGITVGLQVVNATGSDMVGYVDECLVTAGQSEIPQQLGDPVFAWREEGDEVVLVKAAHTSQNVLVVGLGLLSSVSSGTDTMEVDGPQKRRLYSVAGEQFFQQDIDQFEDTSQLQALRRWRHFKNRVDDGFGSMSPTSLRKAPV